VGSLGIEEVRDLALVVDRRQHDTNIAKIFSVYSRRSDIALFGRTYSPKS
jgi:hypothetical protein